MTPLLYKLRGIHSWPTLMATVTSSEVVSTGGKSGRTMNIYFHYPSMQSSLQTGKLVVDDNSSLFGLVPGDTFDLQVNPRRPSHFYCEEASSASQTVRRTILVLGAVFAVAVCLIEFFGR